MSALAFSSSPRDYKLRGAWQGAGQEQVEEWTGLWGHVDLELLPGYCDPG
jgi:hypothetical protein